MVILALATRITATKATTRMRRDAKLRHAETHTAKLLVFSLTVALHC